MKERPVLFSGGMVRAIVAGTKTQTRRVIRPQPDEDGLTRETRMPTYGPWMDTSERVYPCPYGDAGDRLWVRETFATDVPGCPAGFSYRADHLDPKGDGPAHPMTWKPAIHMPRAASRITLLVERVRVERLQDITEEDARAEGVEPFFDRFPMFTRDQCITTGERAIDAPYRASFAVLWDEINGDRALWKSNPWVWCIMFRREGA